MRTDPRHVMVSTDGLYHMAFDSKVASTVLHIGEGVHLKSIHRFDV